MNLNVDPRHADQMVRGVVTLPNGTGKSVRVAVFAKGDKADEAEAAGADIVGAEDLAEQDPGRPDRFRPLHRDARHDGAGRPAREGSGSARPDAEPEARHGDPGRQGRDAAVKGGQVEFRAEKAGIVHAGVGKASFSEEALAENVRAFVDAVNRAKPSGVKGTYVKRVSLSSTMGPGLKLDPSSLGGGPKAARPPSEGIFRRVPWGAVENGRPEVRSSACPRLQGPRAFACTGVTRGNPPALDRGGGSRL